MLGVLAFSFTVPLTRIAVQHGAMSPLFVGSGRAVVAALLAAGALAVTRQRLPRGVEWGRLLIVAGGVAYITGAVFYALQAPTIHREWFGFHELFHAFTVAGFVCHAVAIYRAVLLVA